MVKTVQYREAIIYNKFIPKNYRIKNFEQLRELLIDHPDAWSWFDDQTQKNYVQWCYENDKSEFFEDYQGGNGITEDYVLRKIEAKEEQIEERELQINEWMDEIRVFKHLYSADNDIYIFWIDCGDFVINCMNEEPTNITEFYEIEEAELDYPRVWGTATSEELGCEFADLRWPYARKFHPNYTGIDFDYELNVELYNMGLTNFSGRGATNPGVANTADDITISGLRAVFEYMIKNNYLGAEKLAQVRARIVKRDWAEIDKIMNPTPDNVLAQLLQNYEKTRADRQHRIALERQLAEEQPLMDGDPKDNSGKGVVGARWSGYRENEDSSENDKDESKDFTTEVWFPGDFPNTPYCHMVFYSGYSYYVMDGCVINEAITNLVRDMHGQYDTKGDKLPPYIYMSSVFDVAGYVCIQVSARKIVAYGKGVEWVKRPYDPGKIPSRVIQHVTNRADYLKIAKRFAAVKNVPGLKQLVQYIERQPV